MKLGDIKVTHIILIVAIILWGYLFFDFWKTKYELRVWQTQIINAINNMDQRMPKVPQK